MGEFGRAVEGLGFDHILAYEHVVGAVHADRTPELTGPYTEHDPFHDPFVMFAYLAGITERIHFTTGILVLPQRQTALVARQATDVDLLSGGRLRLGVGVGWNYVEYEALAQDFHTRGARQEEQIGLLRRLFTEPVVDFSGRFDRIDRASLQPKPTRRIPIWLGGSGEKAMDRAARLADGFIFFGGGVDHAIDAWRRLRERVSGVGRSVDDFGGDYVALSGADVGVLTREIDAWRAAGGTHVSVVTMGLGLDSVRGPHRLPGLTRSHAQLAVSDVRTMVLGRVMASSLHSFLATSGPVIRFRIGKVEAMIASEAASPPITVAQYAIPGMLNAIPTWECR